MVCETALSTASTLAADTIAMLYHIDPSIYGVIMSVSVMGLDLDTVTFTFLLGGQWKVWVNGRTAHCRGLVLHL